MNLTSNNIIKHTDYKEGTPERYSHYLSEYKRLEELLKKGDGENADELYKAIDELTLILIYQKISLESFRKSDTYREYIREYYAFHSMFDRFDDPEAQKELQQDLEFVVDSYFNKVQELGIKEDIYIIQNQFYNDFREFSKNYDLKDCNTNEFNEKWKQYSSSFVSKEDFQDQVNHFESAISWAKEFTESSELSKGLTMTQIDEKHADHSRLSRGVSELMAGYEFFYLYDKNPDSFDNTITEIFYYAGTSSKDTFSIVDKDGKKFEVYNLNPIYRTEQKPHSDLEPEISDYDALKKFHPTHYINGDPEMDNFIKKVPFDSLPMDARQVFYDHILYEKYSTLNINNHQNHCVMSNQKLQDVSEVNVQPEYVSNDGKKEVKVGDWVSLKNGQNDYIKGSVTNISSEGNQTVVTIERKQKGFEKTHHQVNLGDNDLYVMRPGQKYDLRELKDFFKGEIYGKKFDDVIKNKKVVYALTRGYRTPIIHKCRMKKKMDDGTMKHYSFDAKIKVYGSGKDMKLKTEIKKQELDEKSEIFGVKFTKQMWDTLKTEGHLGLVHDFANPNGGEIFNAYVSLDREINDLCFVNEKAVDISKIYKTELSEKQQQDLKAGKEITVKDVNLGNHGKKDLTIRVDATKEGIVSNDLNQKLDKNVKQDQEKKNETRKGKGVRI